MRPSLSVSSPDELHCRQGKTGNRMNHPVTDAHLSIMDLPSVLTQLFERAQRPLLPDSYLPAHGGFKASQLLFHSHHVFVVDFDGFCLADPALDVGYFLAYLRPSGLWYYKQGMRQWFEQSARVFHAAYPEAMFTRGITNEIIDSIIERSRLYEGALIFKIATRRVNRLNTPRPQELSAMLDEIKACLTPVLSQNN